MVVATLILRDIHQPSAPSWWPPAPGWWLLALGILALLAGFGWWLRRRRRHRERIAALFDGMVDAAPTPAAQVAAMSELLRRAARSRDANADRLKDAAWRAFLDQGQSLPRFDGELGNLLLDGGYRREVDPEQVAQLRPLVRARFLEWMGLR
ncbi:DUF4381 domain-containing protein [Marilutibacter alkalisoli]|uniref:DUF4381 domain-containing protein n=1 Tax=Marilutibacter alkalisoli TaxID=2591633 RepID=A0A514BP63_9GAMM|nr:DUF4381 domain-containing protein [Lysobacter alkalisoli]QDH69177.1 DUF4381 domain-containing protein [Lysobacter alkalisoli]